MKKKIEPFKVSVEFVDGTKKEFYHHSVDMSLRALILTFKKKMGETEVQKEVKQFVEWENLAISLGCSGYEK